VAPAEKQIIVGGQAVIEGVMMRTPNAYAVAVRRLDGTIETRAERLRPPGEGRPLLRWPIVRGSVVLAQSMSIGVRALNFSASLAVAEEEAQEKKARGEESAPVEASSTSGSIVVAFAFNLLLFFVLPLLVTNLLFTLEAGLPPFPEVGDGWGALWAWIQTLFRPVSPTPAFHLVEGVLRMGLFLGMVWSFSRLKEIQRIFEYHGAEHKTIASWEAGESVTVASAQARPRQHPRCGTSFLMVVMFVSLAVFSWIRFDGWWANLVARLALLPLIAGLSYEVIKAAGARESGRFFQWMTRPGVWLQHLTTREPSSEQLEVAIQALEASLALEPAGRELAAPPCPTAPSA